MMDCHLSEFSFSDTHRHKRLAAAVNLLGEGVVRRLLALALFLFGAKREDIARGLGLPFGTLLSFLTRMHRHGLSALTDRRSSSPTPEAAAKLAKAPPVALRFDKDEIVTDFGGAGRLVTIPRNNLQAKAFLLTLLQNGLLTRGQVAEAIGYSPEHTGRLCAKLREDDLHALLDQRAGQMTDYRIGVEVKAELIQQFAVDILTDGHTSGEALKKGLKERLGLDLSARTIRHHMAKLGLPKIKKSLPQLLAMVKKKSQE